MITRSLPAIVGYSPEMQLQRELRVALDLAHDSGAIALAYQRQGRDALKIRDKGADQGLVTRADTELNEAIVDTLREAFPADAILAEESVDVSDDAWQRADRCWHVDPIDGTSGFSRLGSSWAIHIGLIVDGEPALGVVYEPARGRMSWGVCIGDEREAWGRRGDGPPFRLHREPVALEDLRLVSSKNHASPRIAEVMAALSVPESRNLRISSTGVKMMTVAWGDSDLYVHPRGGTKLWDTAAPHAILRGAGGELSDLRGQALRYRGPGLGNDAGLLACGVSEHPAVSRRLRALADVWLTVT
jgi:3'(2'), 5'-bisphosphate nucleotidase